MPFLKPSCAVPHPLPCIHAHILCHIHPHPLPPLHPHIYLPCIGPSTMPASARAPACTVLPPPLSVGVLAGRLPIAREGQEEGRRHLLHSPLPYVPSGVFGRRRRAAICWRYRAAGGETKPPLPSRTHGDERPPCSPRRCLLRNMQTFISSRYRYHIGNATLSLPSLALASLPRSRAIGYASCAISCGYGETRAAL